MNEFPFVSIIITSLNGRYYLNDCLNSIHRLHYPKENHEIILIDDGSKDRTYEFIKEHFRDIKVIRNQRNRGVAESRNIGIRNAKGELFAFLDNDVRVERNWLFELVKAIEDDRQAGICTSKLLFKDKPEVLNSAGGVMNIYADAWDRGIFEKDKGQYDDKRRVFFGCCAAMLARREVLKKIGYFDPVLYVYEDVDLGWRVNLLGYKVIYVPQSIAFHRLGGTLERNTLRGKYLLERNRIRILAKNYEGKTLLKNMPGLFKFKLARFKIHLRSSRQSKLSLFISALAAWIWNAVFIIDTFKQRKYIQKIKIISDSKIFELLGNYKYKSFDL